MPSRGRGEGEKCKITAFASEIPLLAKAKSKIPQGSPEMKHVEGADYLLGDNAVSCLQARTLCPVIDVCSDV